MGKDGKAWPALSTVSPRRGDPRLTHVFRVRPS